MQARALYQEVGCRRGEKRESDVEGRDLPPGGVTHVQEGLLPQIDGVADDSHSSHRRGIEEPADRSRWLGEAPIQAQRDCNIRHGKTDDEVGHVKELGLLAPHHGDDETEEGHQYEGA